MSENTDRSERENKTVRLHLLVAPSEVSAIDDYRFANRIETRAEAVRRLVAAGLAAHHPTSQEREPSA